MQLSVCANAVLALLLLLPLTSLLSCSALPCPASIRSESLSRDAGITTYQADDKHSSVKNSGMCTTTLHVCSLNRGGRGHKGRVAVMCMHVRTHTYIYTFTYAHTYAYTKCDGEVCPPLPTLPPLASSLPPLFSLISPCAGFHEEALSKAAREGGEGGRKGKKWEEGREKRKREQAAKWGACHDHQAPTTTVA